MSKDQTVYMQWLDRCHRPLPADQRLGWLQFYGRHFAYLNAGGSDA